MLWPLKLDSVGRSYSELLSCLHRSVEPPSNKHMHKILGQSARTVTSFWWVVPAFNACRAVWQFSPKSQLLTQTWMNSWLIMPIHRLLYSLATWSWMRPFLSLVRGSWAAVFRLSLCPHSYCSVHDFSLCPWEAQASFILFSDLYFPWPFSFTEIIPQSLCSQLSHFRQVLFYIQYLSFVNKTLHISKVMEPALCLMLVKMAHNNISVAQYAGSALNSSLTNSWFLCSHCLIAEKASSIRLRSGE